MFYASESVQSYKRASHMYIRTDVGHNTIPAKHPPEDHYADSV